MGTPIETTHASLYKLNLHTVFPLCAKMLLFGEAEGHRPHQVSHQSTNTLYHIKPLLGDEPTRRIFVKG